MNHLNCWTEIQRVTKRFTIEFYEEQAANANKVVETDNLNGLTDPDRKLLLSSTISLLQCKNSALVLSVATLHFYIGKNSIFI